MKRTPRPTDFDVTVEGVGNFVFASRTLGDEIAIQREYANIIGGVESPTDWLVTMAGWLSVLRTITVRAPEGWDLESMDPLASETYEKLYKTYTALREKEDSFRQGVGASGQAVSA